MTALYRRKPGWESRLFALISARQNTQFQWGVQDCCTWAADCIHAVTGDRPPLPTGYHDLRGALRAIEPFGSIEAGFSGWLGDPIDPRLAQRGDPVLLDQPGLGATMGVLLGTEVLLAGPDGLVRLPASAIQKAWHLSSHR